MTPRLNGPRDCGRGAVGGADPPGTNTTRGGAPPRPTTAGRPRISFLRTPRSPAQAGQRNGNHSRRHALLISPGATANSTAFVGTLFIVPSHRRLTVVLGAHVGGVPAGGLSAGASPVELATE